MLILAILALPIVNGGIPTSEALERFIVVHRGSIL